MSLKNCFVERISSIRHPLATPFSNFIRTSAQVLHLRRSLQAKARDGRLEAIGMCLQLDNSQEISLVMAVKIVQ